MPRPHMLPFSPDYDFQAAKIITIMGKTYQPGEVIDRASKGALGPGKLQTLYEGRRLKPCAPTYPKLPDRPAVKATAADLGVEDPAEDADSVPEGSQETPASAAGGEGAGDGAEASSEPDTGGEGNAPAGGQEKLQEQPDAASGQDSAGKGAKASSGGQTGSESGSYATLEDAVAELRKTDLSGFQRPLTVTHKGFGRWYATDAAGSLVLAGHMKKPVAERFAAEHLARA